MYFPELGSAPLTVNLITRSERPRSCLYRFSLAAASLRRDVIVKVSDPPRRHASAHEAARLLFGAIPPASSELDEAELPQLRYEGLRLIHEHFSSLGDPRFGSVRPLDYLPERRAVIMEHVDEPTLREAMQKGSRLAIRRSGDVAQAFGNTGAWLRKYHQLVPAQAIATRGATRAELLETMALYARYLATVSNDESFFSGLTDRLDRHALHDLPERLPLGLTHADFLPRNVFVGAGYRVTAFDALPRWRVPIYRDLARFTVGLRSVGPQVATMGMAYSRERLEEYERSFLEGYFATGATPLRSVQLYEMLVVLERWAWLKARSGQALKRKRIQKGVQLRLMDAFFRREAGRLLGELEAGGRTS